MDHFGYHHLANAIALGLRYGNLALWALVFCHVVFNWRPLIHGGPVHMSRRWRWTWAIVAAAVVVASLAHINALRGQYLPAAVAEMLWLASLMLFAAGGVMVNTGLGEPGPQRPRLRIGMVAALPVAFVILTVAGVR